MLPIWVPALLLLALLSLGEGYSVWQPCHLSGQATESIILPCNFSYTWKEAPKRDIGVYWRLEHFHSKTFIFNYTMENTYTHPNFSGRVSLIGDPMKSWQASIQILNLSESDSNIYFCRISAQTVEGMKEWQSVRGTNLTVITGAPTQIYRALGMVAGAILAIIAVSLGLLMLLAWKKGEGLHKNEITVCLAINSSFCPLRKKASIPGRIRQEAKHGGTVFCPAGLFLPGLPQKHESCRPKQGEAHGGRI